MEVKENIELYGIGSCIQALPVQELPEPSQRIDQNSRGMVQNLLATLSRYIFHMPRTQR
jgi:hypothetical protein